ncbi:hypothetical protein ACFWNU_33160, partial [Streptomyces sp. NPDC058427]
MTVRWSKANVTDTMRMALVIAVRGTATRVSDDQRIFGSIVARVLKRIETDYHVGHGRRELPGARHPAHAGDEADRLEWVGDGRLLTADRGRTPAVRASQD